eukprot:4504941-Heterocapsa_arctica.AAC.1
MAAQYKEAQYMIAPQGFDMEQTRTIPKTIGVTTLRTINQTNTSKNKQSKQPTIVPGAIHDGSTPLGQTRHIPFGMNVAGP